MRATPRRRARSIAPWRRTNPGVIPGCASHPPNTRDVIEPDAAEAHGGRSHVRRGDNDDRMLALHHGSSPGGELTTEPMLMLPLR